MEGGQYKYVENMKKSSIIIIAISLFAVICNVYALPDKKNSISSGFGEKVVPIKDDKSTTKIIKEIVTRHQDDTVYCLATEKKFGWQIPLGVITKEEARNRAFSIRLSNKNKAGNFCNLEVLGKDFNPIAGDMSLTISKFLPDSVAKSSDYLQSCSNIHRLTEIPDYSGKHIIQERFYDVNNNLIGYVQYHYTDNYYRVKDCYFGPNGLPIKIAESETTPYGVQLNSVYDENGNDSILFLTSGNTVVPNKDGAYYWQSIHFNDKNGIAQNIIRSLDVNHLPMIDKYGNCGMYKILDRFNNDSISTFIDINDKPINLPETSYDKNFINVSSVKSTNDYTIFKTRCLEYFDRNGNKCENVLGTHKVVVDYDTFGNETQRQGFGLNNNLSPIDDNGVAKYCVVWDMLGNIIEYHQYDSDSKPVSRNGNNSSYYNTYFPDSKNIKSRIGYIYNDSTNCEEIDYIFKYSSRADSLLYSDKSSKIVNYDSLGRITSVQFFDKLGNRDVNTYCAIDSTEYICNIKENVNKTINREYRANGSMQSEIITDSISYTKTFFSYDESGYKTDSYKQRYTNKWSLIGQTDCSELGIPSRAGGNAGVRYLHANISRTFDGSFNSFEILDEFDEPDYLINLFDGGEIYSSFGKNESRYQARILRDEFGNEISDYKQLQDNLPKVMSVEVINPIAYDLGFRDNDIILIYGDFFSNLEDVPTFYDFRRDWTLASIIEANKISRMVVFRIDNAKGNQFGLVELNNLQGTLSQLGINAHIRYLTQRQKKRILSSILANKDSHSPILIDTDLKNKKIYDGDNNILLAYTDLVRTIGNKPYAKQITDPAILLGACIKDLNLYWTMDASEKTDTFEEMLDSRKSIESRYPFMKMYLTTDMVHIKPLYLKGQGVYTSWFDTKVSTDVYSELLRLNKISNTKIDSIKYQSPTFSSKNLIANWQVASDNKNSLYQNVTGNLNFKKNGRCEGKLCYYGMISFDEGDAIYKIEKDFTGLWEHTDSLIRLHPSSENNIQLNCVDLVGADEELKARALAYMNSICDSNKDDLLNKMSYLGIQCGNGLFIHSLKKDSLYIDNGSGFPIVLTKNKRVRKSSNKKLNPNKSKQLKNGNSYIANSQLVGCWRATIPDLPKSLVLLNLMEDGSMKITINAAIEQELSETSEMSAILDMKLGGNWNSYNEKMKLSSDPSLMIIDIDIRLSGVSKEDEELIRPLLMNELNSQKEKLAMDILKNSPFDGEMSISDISYNSFVMNGNKWERHNNLENE